jgi:DnaJ-class molecular chaperone
MRVAEAVALLGLQPREVGSRERIQYAFRQAARQHHPDRGGDPVEFNRFRLARDFLLQVLDEAGCSNCGGTGKVTLQRGFSRLDVVCPRCHGSGKV